MTATREHLPGVTHVAGARPDTPPDTLPECWFAVWVMSNAESVVLEALHGYGIEAFLPTWCEVVEWSDRRKLITRPLFPGYLFVRCADRRVPDIVQIAGVIKVLPENLTPLPVDPSEIANIRRLLALGRPLKVCDYITGDAVTIDSGAFAGVKGIVQRTKNGTRVVVKIEILHRAVSVEIEASDLVKAPDELVKEQKAA